MRKKNTPFHNPGFEGSYGVSGVCPEVALSSLRTTFMSTQPSASNRLRLPPFRAGPPILGGAGTVGHDSGTALAPVGRKVVSLLGIGSLEGWASTGKEGERNGGDANGIAPGREMRSSSWERRQASAPEPRRGVAAPSRETDEGNALPMDGEASGARRRYREMPSWAVKDGIPEAAKGSGAGDAEGKGRGRRENEGEGEPSRLERTDDPRALDATAEAIEFSGADAEAKSRSILEAKEARASQGLAGPRPKEDIGPRERGIGAGERPVDVDADVLPRATTAAAAFTEKCGEALPRGGSTPKMWLSLGPIRRSITPSHAASFILGYEDSKEQIWNMLGHTRAMAAQTKSVTVGRLYM
jgi:hypothetical protein